MNILVTMPKGIEETTTFLTDLALEKLHALGNVTFNPHERHYTREELKEALKGIDVVFCSWGSACYDDEILDAADSLKLIAYCAGTVAGMASPAIFERGITLLRANCVFAESVAEGALTYSLIGLRRIEHYSQLVRQGGWRDGAPQFSGLLDRTVGLVGFGAIAQEFVKLLKPFRCRVLVNSGHLSEEDAAFWGVEKASLEEVFAQSDVVSIHHGNTPRTFHMVKREHLDLMRDGALIINTARGAVIDEAELIKVLETGRISAVLDVLEKEPPAVDSILRKLPNVTILPHMGGPTIDRRQYCVTKLCEDVTRFFAGEDPSTFDTYVSEDMVANMSKQ